MLVQCHLTSLRGFTAYTKQAGTRSAGSATLHCGAVALHVATKLLELLTWIYLGAMLGSLTLTLWHPLQGAQREGKHSWKEQLATLQKQINPDYQPPAQSVDSPAEQLDSPAFIGELDSDESFDGSDLGEEDTFNLAMETGSSTSLAGGTLSYSLLAPKAGLQHLRFSKGLLIYGRRRGLGSWGCG